VSFLPERTGDRSNRWLTTLVLDPARARTDPVRLAAALEALNIEARPVWKPLHEQLLYAGADYSGGDVASTLASRSLNLPSGTGMSADDFERVLAALRGELLA
jgi:pyridoxal phosphate-dependent aminotransferase EpsN